MRLFLRPEGTGKNCPGKKQRQEKFYARHHELNLTLMFPEWNFKRMEYGGESTISAR
ncbi:hypothetical protein HHJ06_10665 [Akkermansia muciniphila]|nr:hypothetical protein [Akkermansia muciniphila]